MTHAIEDTLVVNTPARNAAAEPIGQPLAQLQTEQVRRAAEPSHIHIPRPSRARRSDVDGR